MSVPPGGPAAETTAAIDPGRLRAMLRAYCRAPEPSPPVGLGPLLDAPGAGEVALALLDTLTREGALAEAGRLAAALRRHDGARQAGKCRDAAATRLHRARILRAAGATEEALAELRATCAGEGGADPAIALAAADLFCAGGALEEAAAVLARAAAAAPGHAALLRRAALVETWRGHAPQAVALLREALRLDPVDAPTRERLARQLAAAGRPGEALAALRDAPAPSPALAAAFAAIALPALRLALPDRLDERLLAEVAEAVGAAGERLPPDLVVEALRIAETLGHRDPVRRLPAAGTGPLCAALLGGDGAPPSAEPRTLPQALLREGMALHAAGRGLRAGLCFELAHRLDPADPAARLNAGFAVLAEGCVAAAREAFAGLDPAGEAAMARVAWPRRAGGLWPRAAFPLAAGFEAMRPPGRDWPVITLVTPSLDQAAFLEDTILSVLRQDYPRLQYILVDGGSTDGSRDIIERHRAAFDAVIIEPDGGQAEAINKGLRLARGELVGWLNSDDMLAPGALHAAALAWMRSGADILHGHCLAHRDGALLRAHVPRATTAEFTPEAVGDVFGRWLRGDFFYQPEVLFSRRILEAAGGALREDLRYTMDYEFWLRCAARGATLAPVGWPVALFRHHRAQKTAERRATLLEQAAVRDAAVRIEPPPERAAAIRAALRKALQAPRRPVRLGLLSARLRDGLGEDAAAELAEALAPAGVALTLAAAEAELADADLVLMALHGEDDLAAIGRLRDKVGFTGPLIGWFLEEHADPAASAAVAERLDLAVPAHAVGAPLLRNRRALLLPVVPPAGTGWSRREAAALFQAAAGTARQDRIAVLVPRHPLSGLPEAQAMVLAAELGAAPLPEGGAGALRRCLAHKAALLLPSPATGLPEALFAALAAGAVPILPRDAASGLDALIPPAQQATLPILRPARRDAASLAAAAAAACAAFDAGGAAGAEARHRLALDGHGLPQRVSRLLEEIRRAATAP